MLSIVRRLLLCLALAGTAALAQPERPVHVVVSGDTLYGIAARHGTTVDALRHLNDLPGDLLRVGMEIALPYEVAEPDGYRPYLAGAEDTWDRVAEVTGRSIESLSSANPEIPFGEEPAGRLLLIPPDEGVTLRVRVGETWATLAARYDLDLANLAARNGLDPSEPLISGQPVLLPTGTDVSATVDSAPAVGTAASSVAGAAAAGDPRSFHRDAQTLLLATAPALLVGMSWPDTGFDVPVFGPLSSAFGWRNISVGGNRFHGGIDIAAPPGTPVTVSRPGVVTRTGWIGAYGNAVYVDHGDGSQTRYAHMRAIYVRPGDVLLRGDSVGEVGSTGASTGPHLHFEVRIDGRAVDPLAYLNSR